MIKRPKAKKKTFALELLDAIVSAFLIALLIRSIFIEVAMIPSSSMEDTLLEKDQLFVDKFMYGISIPFTKIKIHIMDKRTPKRGQIIVFIPPDYSKSDKPLFVKRCMGVPGDEIRMENNILYVNGKKLGESYLKIEPAKRALFKDWPFSEKGYYTFYREDLSRTRDAIPSGWPPEGAAYILPEGYYFMMGDHRSDSYDSRFWGPVPRRNIIGIARFRFFPFDRIGFIK